MKNRKAAKHGVTNLANQPVSPIDGLVRKLDLLSCEMETLWGTGVLHSLCGSETSAKFITVKNRLDQSIQSGDYDNVKRDTEILMRGWQKMDAEAREAGHKPEGVDLVWYVSSPQFGLDYIVCRHELDAARLVAAHPDKASSVYILKDIAKMIDRDALPNHLSKDKEGYIKEMMERAKREENNKKPMESDDIPFFG